MSARDFKLRPTRALIPMLALAFNFGATAHANEEGAEGMDLIPHQIGKVAIEGGLTWYLQATDGAPTNTTALTYTLDLVFQAPVSSHGKAVVALEAGDGLGVDNVINPLSITNYDAYYTNIRSAGPGGGDVVVPSVSQAYYEGEYQDGRLVVDLGKLDVHAAYDDNAYANDETDQFLSGMFTRSPGTSFAELDRYYAPGVALTYGLSGMIDLTVVAANGNNAGFDDIFDYPYLVGQVNFKPALGGRDGNYRFFVISDGRRNAFTEINGGAATNNTAWGVSFDQAVADGVGLFARYNVQDDSIAENIVKGTWSLGAALEGGLWGRESDAVGIGYGSVLLNDKANPAAALGVADTGDESHLEIYYKFGVSENFTLTADVQVINNLGGDASSDTVTVAGLRGQLNF